MNWREHIARSGTGWFPGEPWARWTFMVLFLLAAVLRFWDLPNIGFTHDELSALSRIYPSLVKTIEVGVIELDTHPPGVQVFEWAWTSSFGTNSGVVKTPFIILGLLALFFLYRFALAWTSPATALMLTAYAATLQYFVMYGQIARPYAIGLFTTALLADQLTRYLAHGKRSALIIAGVAAVLSAYAHHFSLLMAAIMVISVLFLVPVNNRKSYLIMCVVAALAYLPNLPIFLKQLSYGGLSEWLAPPDGYWLGDALSWLTHYSIPLAVITVLIVAMSIWLRFKGSNSTGPGGWLLLLWGLLPFAIAWGYSVWRAPVLQYSVLLFSFPYLLIALFSGLGRLDRRLAVVVPLVVAVVSVHSLVTVRHHFQVFYGSIFGSVVGEGAEFVARNGAENALLLIDAPQPQVQFFIERSGLSNSKFRYVQLRGKNAAQVDSVLANSKARAVFLGTTNGSIPEQIARIQVYFPSLIRRSGMVEGELLEFTKEPSSGIVQDRTLITSAVPGQISDSVWDIHADLPIENYASSKAYWNFRGREYGLCWTADIDQLYNDPRDLFEVVVELEQVEPAPEASVVVELHVGDSTLFYRRNDLHEINGLGPRSLVTGAARADLPRGIGKVRMKAYVYNPEKGLLLIRSMRIYRRDANPVQHALISPIVQKP